MEPEQVIFSYLRMRGLKNAQNALKLQAKMSNTPHLKLCDQLMTTLFKDIYDKSQQQIYAQAFRKLHQWVQDSIDYYRPELQNMLPPIFIYMYLDMLYNQYLQAASEFYQEFSFNFSHLKEVQMLSSITTPTHLQSEFVQTLLTQKYQVPISQFALNLLVSYLQDSNYRMVLRIINQHIRLKFNCQANFSTPVLMSEEYLILNQYKPLALSSHYKQLEDNRRKQKIPVSQISSQMEYIRKQEQERRTNLANRLPDIICHTVTNKEVLSMDISEDGSLIACGLDNHVIWVWDLLNKSNSELIGHSGGVFSLCLQIDKRLLISGSDDCTVRLWSLVTKSTLVIYRYHQFPVWSVDFSPIGFYFVSGSNDKTALVWTTDSAKPIRILVGHLSDVTIAKFHRSVNYVVTSSSDRTVRFWDISNGNCLRIFAGHLYQVCALVFSRSGRVLLTADEKGCLKSWNVEQQSLNWEVQIEGTPECVQVSQDDQVVAVGFLEQKVVLASGGGELMKEYLLRDTPVVHLSFSRMNLLSVGGFLVSNMDG